MANKEHLQRLLEAVASRDLSTWNQWRKENPHLKPDLGQAKLSNAGLQNADLSDANMNKADLSGAILTGSNLNGTNLNDANLRGADLSGANLRCAHLRRADLDGANLTNADLRFAELRGSMLSDARFLHAKINPEDLMGTGLKSADLGRYRAEKRTIIRLPIRAGIDRLVNTARRLFKHEQAVTLGLFDSENPTENQLPKSNATNLPSDSSKGL